MSAEIYRLFRGLLFLPGYIVNLPDPGKQSKDDNAFHRAQAHRARIAQDLQNHESEVKDV
jgi:hypothetical protein